MPFEIHADALLAASDDRVEAGRQTHYALVYDDVESYGAGSGILRLELSATGSLYVSVEEPSAEDPGEAVRVRPVDVEQALHALSSIVATSKVNFLNDGGE